MITYERTRNSINKPQIVDQVTYKQSELSLRHQLQRRADLTNQPVISLLKHYAKEGIKNDLVSKQSVKKVLIDTKLPSYRN